MSAFEVAEQVRVQLEHSGFGHFQIAEAEIAGRAGARLDCAKHDAGRVWAVRQYIVIHGANRFILGCGSSVPEEDDPLFTTLAERFEITEPDLD